MPQLARPAPDRDDGELPRMSLLQHLEELRRRLVYSLGGVALAFVGCWIWVDEIFGWFERPVVRVLPEGRKLAVFGPAEAFLLYFKVAALAALFVASPIVLYQAWRFVAPGLYRRERLWGATFVVVGSLLFVAGGLFAYFVASPFAIEFLIGMGQRFDPVIGAEKYLGFELAIILGLGLMFELPMFIFALAQIGVVTPRFLLRNFRWAVVIIFTVAAVITPTPDVVNLCIFSLPAIALYLLGVGAAALVQRRKSAAPT
jgi:sec-independent protein translocase protein TatC